MQITITGRHFELTDPIKNYTENGIKGLKKYFDNIIFAEMVLATEKNRNIAELNLQVKKLNLVSKSTEHDMYFAIDQTIKKMERQIKKYIGKKRNQYQNKKVSFKEIDEQHNEIQKKVTYKKVMSPTLTPENAIIELESNKKDYLFFKNRNTNRMNFLKVSEDGYEISEIQ